LEAVIEMLFALINTIRGIFLFGLAEWLTRKPNQRLKNSNQKHLVIFVTSFPPHISGGVYRPVALAFYAKRAGYRVTVFASEAPDNPSKAGLSLLAYLGNDVEIVRVSVKNKLPSYFLFPKLDGGLIFALEMFFKARKYLGSSSVDAIFCSGPSFNVFVAGYWSSRILGAPLVLDYRDEWTSCPFDFVSKGENDAKWESRCLEEAKTIIFTTDSQRDLLVSQHPSIINLYDKCHTVHNGWDPSQRKPLLSSKITQADQRIVLVFAGSLGSHTSIRPFLAALDQVIKDDASLQQRLLVRVIGQKYPEEDDTIAKFRFPDVIESIPLVPITEATQYMQEADALLLILDHRWRRYLQGKLYEYLASGRPIIVCDDDGEASHLVTKYKAGWLVDTNQPRQLREALDHLFNKDWVPSSPELDEWLNEHTREALTKRMLKLIDTLGS
jgi:glycosyltransferase involved in cell wall biosynthesis